ncbi:hypothetical protein AB0O75_38875 [Streptomyces sp. NPDC088921]|uniref:hypothetical protein n=1 Tax=unclassified Streptomyces TaxID=2593676 RepID=UPI003419DC8B
MFFFPLAGMFGWVAFHLLGSLDEGLRWLRLTVAVLGLAVAAGCVVIVFLPLYLRRTGGPAPRLYCFEDGVVVATGRLLRPYDWQEISIESEKWRSQDDYGTRRTVKGPDGGVIVRFNGSEGDSCGAWLMERLYEAAVERGAGGGVVERHEQSAE